jgi:hypothetical protein
MKKYLLTIFGEFGTPEKYTEITITLTPLVDSPSLKFQYGKEFLIAHFASELHCNEIYEFLEMSSYGLYDSFILNEYEEKNNIFMSEENKKHLFELNNLEENNGKEMKLTSNNIEDYPYEDDEFVSTLMRELKKHLKPPTLDQILDKISIEGFDGLTQFEKGLLENYSKN